MKLKIYFDDKPVFLCDQFDEELLELNHHPDTLLIDELSAAAIHSLLHEIEKEEFHAAILQHHDFDLLKKTFFKHFTFLHAAGGIVQNNQKELLFIFRLGKWDLPKGKLDDNESPEIAAEREIKEETGVDHVKLHYKIGETYHVYHAFGKHIIKQSDWFYFSCNADQQLAPQTEENITEVKWIPTKDIKQPMLNTYATIKDIMRKFFDTP